MTTKYKKPKANEYSKLIKYFADGAVIQMKAINDWLTVNPSWATGSDYRVEPKCEYALYKISELGDDIAELYNYWLDGQALEFKNLLDNWWTLKS